MHREHESAVLYPYTRDEVQLMRYDTPGAWWRSIVPVCLPGTGLSGHDAGEIDGGPAVGVRISSDLSECLSQTDVVVVTPRGGDVAADAAMSRLRRLEASGRIYVRMAAKAAVAEIPPASAAERTEGISSLPGARTRAPVIVVMGEGRSTGKFELQLKLRREITSQGYKLAQFGTGPYCHLFGFGSLPLPSRDRPIDPDSYVAGLRRLIFQVERQTSPDVIVLGIPGGYIPIDQRIHNGYGVLHWLVCAAVAPDVAVVATYYRDFDRCHRKELETLVGNRFDVPSSFFVVSSTWLDHSLTQETGRQRSVILRNTPKRERARRSAYPYDNLLHSESLSRELWSEICSAL